MKFKYNYLLLMISSFKANTSSIQVPIFLTSRPYDTKNILAQFKSNPSVCKNLIKYHS